MGSEPSRTPLTWAQSFLWLGFGLLAMLASAVTLMTALTEFTPPGLFQTLRLEGLALGVAYYGTRATAEEVAKAIGVGVAKLRCSRMNWFWITTFTAGSLGTLERLLWLMNATPAALNRLLGAMPSLFVAHTALVHAALSVVCVLFARLVGRGWIGWLAGVGVAGALHMLHNLLPLRIDFGGELVWPAITGAISLAIIGVAFALRKRLDWRS